MGLFGNQAKDYNEAAEERVEFFTPERKKDLIAKEEDFFIAQCFQTTKANRRGKYQWILECHLCMSAADAEPEKGMLSFELGSESRDNQLELLREYLKKHKGEAYGPVFLREIPVDKGRYIKITDSELKDTEHVPF